MQEWLKTFCRAGTARAVAGNNPLKLDDPEKVWIVTAGHVDLFAVPCEEGHGLGERIHVHRVHPGEVLLGIANDESTSLRLIAVGPPGTRVHELSHSRFSGIEDHSTELAALVDRWIDGLTAGVSRGGPAGRVSLLAAEEEGLHRAGRSVTPTQGVFWISGSELNGEWLGQIELSLSEEAVFPLAGSGWLDISQATKLRAVKTSSLVPDDRLWAGLAGFHRATLSCIALNLQEAERAEAERLVQKSHSDDRLAQSTLARLAATVEPEKSEAELALEHEAPILAACRLVGERLGMEIRAPRDFARKTWSDPVSAIARASELRIRRVTLRGPWWRQDGGPLLAFRGDTQQPTALLPTSATSYEMVDPATGTRVPVTQAIASELGSFGYCFFRSFPPHTLTSWDVFQFALAGTRRDWGTVALLGLAGGLLGMLIPIGTGILFGRIIPASDHGQLMWLVLALAVTAVVMTLFEFVQGVASVRLETRMNASVEVGVWDRLLNLPTSFFRQYSTGDLAMRSNGHRTYTPDRDGGGDVIRTGFCLFACFVRSAVLPGLSAGAHRRPVVRDRGMRQWMGRRGPTSLRARELPCARKGLVDRPPVADGNFSPPRGGRRKTSPCVLGKILQSADQAGLPGAVGGKQRFGFHGRLAAPFLGAHLWCRGTDGFNEAELGDFPGFQCRFRPDHCGQCDRQLHRDVVVGYHSAV